MEGAWGQYGRLGGELLARITGIGTAVPSFRFEQDAIFQVLFADRSTDQRARSIFENSAISTRHAVLPRLELLLNNPSTRERNQIYVQEAPCLAMAAARRGLDQAGLSPRDIDLLVVVSCTGYEIPGLDLALASALDMRPDLHRTCVLGMGCYAAFPGLMRARDAVLAHPASRALLVAIELCSLHFQSSNTDEDVVSSSLFADGAAAVIVEAQGNLVMVDAETFTQYHTAEHMAFSLTDHGFKMRLSSYVPHILTLHIKGFVEGVLARNGIKTSDIRYWGIHPGGRKILDRIQEEFALHDAQIASSRRVLRDYGNMSSPTILFVLEDILQQGTPQVGDHVVLLAFGPGLTMEVCLLRWEH